MPEVFLCASAYCQNRVVGLLDRFGQKTRPKGGIVEVGVFLHRRLARPEVPEHGIDGNPAGDFPGCVAAHSIAYHENAEPLVVAETVFVGRPHPSYIGQPGHV